MSTRDEHEKFVRAVQEFGDQLTQPITDAWQKLLNAFNKEAGE